MPSCASNFLTRFSRNVTFVCTVVAKIKLIIPNENPINPKTSSKIPPLAQVVNKNLYSADCWHRSIGEAVDYNKKLLTTSNE